MAGYVTLRRPIFALMMCVTLCVCAATLRQVDAAPESTGEDRTGLPLRPYDDESETEEELIPIDILPGEYPNPIDVEYGWHPPHRTLVPVALVGTEEFDVTTIDVFSIRLSRVDGVGGSIPPIFAHYHDVATPFGPVEPDECEGWDAEGDGADDLSLKFLRLPLVWAMRLDDLPGGTVVPLKIRARSRDRTRRFVGYDCVVIVPFDDDFEDCNDNGVPDEVDLGVVPTHLSFSAEANAPIPDCTGFSDPHVSSTIEVPETPGAITRVTVEVVLTHSRVGDLLLTLEHEDTGTEIALMSRIGLDETNPFCIGGECCGCEAAGLHVIFAGNAATNIESACPGEPGGSYRPSAGASGLPGALSAFIGEEPTGSWKLRVYDGAQDEKGTLDRWELNIERQVEAVEDDCNYNGTPDSCDIAEGISLDVDSDGVPDECQEFLGFCDVPGQEDFWTCYENWPLGGLAYPDDEDSAAGVHVTLPARDDVFLDETVKIPSLTLAPYSMLRITQSDAQGDLRFSGPAIALIKGTLVAGGTRTIGAPDEAAGQLAPHVTIGPDGRYVGVIPTRGFPDAATMIADDLVIKPGICFTKGGGGVVLTNQMRVIVLHDLILDGAPSIDCGFFRENLANTAGITIPPKLVNEGDSTVEIEGSLHIDDAAESTNTSSTGGVILAGDFDNQSLYPSLFDWEQGRLEMNGTEPQVFEVAGLDFGAIDEGFSTNADTLFDTDPHTNFSIGVLQIGSSEQAADVEFVNTFANTAGAGACQEAIFVHDVIIEPGSSITLNNCRLYYDTLQNNGGSINTIGCGSYSEVCATDAPVRLPMRMVRYLPFNGGNAGRLMAMRVTFPTLPAPFDGFSGKQMWVGPPREVSLLGGLDDATPPTFWAAKLQCEPYETDWSGYGTVHVHHEAIVPFGSFEVQAIHAGCNSAIETNYSAAAAIPMSRWGDIAGAFNNVTRIWGPPDDSVDVAIDVIAVIDAFRSTPTAPNKPRADVEPGKTDQLINITDAVAVVDAFRGVSYPFPPAPDPCP